MLWHPMHIAVLACIDLAPAGAAAWGAAAGGLAGAWACDANVTEATARAKSADNRWFILRAQSGGKDSLINLQLYPAL